MTILEQKPANQPITIKSGDDFNRLVTFTGVNMTGYTLSAGINTVSGVIPITITASDLSTGKVYISLTDTQTALIPATGSTWFFKWTITDQTRTLLEGEFLTV